jgi:hypothetical protein
MMQQSIFVLGLVAVVAGCVKKEAFTPDSLPIRALPADNSPATSEPYFKYANFFSIADNDTLQWRTTMSFYGVAADSIYPSDYYVCGSSVRFYWPSNVLINQGQLVISVDYLNSKCTFENFYAEATRFFEGNLYFDSLRFLRLRLNALTINKSKNAEGGIIINWNGKKIAISFPDKSLDMNGGEIEILWSKDHQPWLAEVRSNGEIIKTFSSFVDVSTDKQQYISFYTKIDKIDKTQKNIGYISLQGIELSVWK